MIEKRRFYNYAVGIVFLMGGFLGFNHFHIGTHHNETATEVKQAPHVHSVYWIKNQEKPGLLIEVKNRVYGEPKPDIKHRHTGEDYWQANAATWKHVHDQHIKTKD